MKKDILANLYQKCFIICSKVLLNMLHNFVTMVTYWDPDLPNTKGISLASHFHNCKRCLIYMIQQAYKYVSLSLWVGTGKE